MHKAIDIALSHKVEHVTFVVKESTTNYVIMLQKHNEVEQTLLKCQLHWPPT